MAGTHSPSCCSPAHTGLPTCLLPACPSPSPSVGLVNSGGGGGWGWDRVHRPQSRSAQPLATQESSRWAWGQWGPVVLNQRQMPASLPGGLTQKPGSQETRSHVLLLVLAP